MMQQYHDVVRLKYRTLHAAYDLETSQNEPTATSQTNKKFQLSWIFGGKKKIEEMIDECDSWNDKLFEIIQIYILEKSFLALFTDSSLSRSSSRFEQLKHNDCIKTLGLSEDIDLIRISKEGDLGWKDLELFTAIAFDKESRGRLKLGTYDNQRVLGDFKVFQPTGKDFLDLGAAEPPKAVLDRIRQLAVLMNRQHSVQSRLLRCRGFYPTQVRPTSSSSTFHEVVLTTLYRSRTIYPQARTAARSRRLNLVSSSP